MKEEKRTCMDTHNYKIGQLERAIIELRNRVVQPQNPSPLHLMPTQILMLLEASRIGLARMYEDETKIPKGYPFP